MGWLLAILTVHGAVRVRAACAVVIGGVVEVYRARLGAGPPVVVLDRGTGRIVGVVVGRRLVFVSDFIGRRLIGGGAVKILLCGLPDLFTGGHAHPPGGVRCGLRRGGTGAPGVMTTGRFAGADGVRRLAGGRRNPATMAVTTATSKTTTKICSATNTAKLVLWKSAPATSAIM